MVSSFSSASLEVRPLTSSERRYIVAFRSTRAPGSPSVDLYEADRLAHEEAVSVRLPSPPLRSIANPFAGRRTSGVLVRTSQFPRQQSRNLHLDVEETRRPR